MANGKLPHYLASAKPNPPDNRAPWYKTTAQTYAGIMLWFVFWDNFPFGAGLGQGLAVGLLSLVAAALVCHFLFYLVPGLLGMQTGLPLYIVGTSTYGAKGGFLMPGVLMGVLQFGWLAVNGFFAGDLLCGPFGHGFPSVPHAIVASVWIILGAFIGVKGIQYVAKVATFMPLIPLVILIILFVMTAGGIGSFDTQMLTKAGEDAVPPLSTFGILALVGTYVVGFFATAGAAGTDLASNNRDARDVHLGGLTGIALAKVFAAGVAMLIVAGAYGSQVIEPGGALKPTAMMEAITGSKQAGGVMMYLLALAAFPAACFSSLIAANSFKATLPKVKPLYSCGLGAIAAIILAVTGLAGRAIDVFQVIGASFGPVCGAMAADYLLAGRKWPGPRAAFNLAGWISWVVGFAVGAVEFIALIPGLEGLAGKIPCPPVAAFIVGFVLYVLLAMIGLQGKTLKLPVLEPGPHPEAEVPEPPHPEVPAP